MKALWASLPFLPLLLTAAPRSFLAHDEGYYALQARWIAQSGQWLGPPWWDQVVFDRSIGLLATCGQFHAIQRRAAQPAAAIQVAL
jgi:4-amino-4-deoxy-L-arabinose transferase-like glycosyltransferase